MGRLRYVVALMHLALFILILMWLIVHFSDDLKSDDILNMAMTGMLAADHDLQHGFPDPGPLPSINTVFISEADKPCY